MPDDVGAELCERVCDWVDDAESLGLTDWLGVLVMDLDPVFESVCVKLEDPELLRVPVEEIVAACVGVCVCVPLGLPDRLGDLDGLAVVDSEGLLLAEVLGEADWLADEVAVRVCAPLELPDWLRVGVELGEAD